MRILYKFFRSYPMSLLCIAAIWELCLMDVPETPLSDVSLIDKWAHVSMYFCTCLIIGFEYCRAHRLAGMSWRCFALWVWMLPALMSGLIEIVQATCTGGNRSGEWLDFFANCIGATFGFAVCSAFIRWMNARKG